MTRTIPKGAILFKEGLYIHEFEASMGTLTWMVWELYSADGWQFYDLSQGENYDEEGNLLPEDKLVYSRFMTMPKDAEYVANNIVSVPIQDNNENHEVM